MRALELHLYAAKRAGKSYRGVCKVVSARAYSSQLGVRQVYVYIAEFARAVYGKRTALNFGPALAEALFGNNESYGIAHGHVFYSELSVFVGEFGNGCAVYAHSRIFHFAAQNVFHRSFHGGEFGVRKRGKFHVFNHNAAVCRTQFRSRIGDFVGYISVFGNRNRIRFVTAHLAEGEETVAVGGLGHLLAARRYRNGRALHKFPCGRVEHRAAYFGVGLLHVLATHEVAVFIPQHIVVYGLRLDEIAVISPAVPVPIYAVLIAKPHFVYLTERNAHGVVFLYADLSVRNHYLKPVALVVGLCAVIECAAELNLVVDKSVPAAPLSARALHYAGFAVYAEVYLEIVALWTQSAVGERVYIKLYAVALGNGIVVGVSVG